MKVLLWITMLLSVAVVLAQAPDTMWTQVVGGSGTEWGYSVQQTIDGGYIIAGWTDSYGAGGKDIYLVKLDSTGDVEWTQTYGGSEDDEGFDVQQTTDGGYIIAGGTESFGVDSMDCYLIRTDNRGDTLWTRTYGGVGEDFARSVQLTGDGGYILAGRTSSYSAGWQREMYIIKVNSSGESLWVNAYSFSWRSYGASSIRQTTDSGYIIAGGYYFWISAPISAMVLVKVDSLGSVLWYRYYRETNDGWASDVQLCEDRGYIVAGHNGSYSSGTTGAYLVRTDTFGDTLWTRIYGEGNYSHAFSVDLTADGGYILAGQTNVGTQNDDMFLIRVDSNGDTLWTRTFGSEEDEWGLSVCKTQDEGYILTGFTEFFGSGGYNLYVVRTEPDTASTNIPIVKRNGNPKSYTLNSPYPNPFNAVVTVGFELPVMGEVGIQLYDVLGRKVGTLVDEVMQQGAHSAYWDAGEMSSGIYFVQMSARTPMGEAGTFREVRKVVLLK